MPKITNTTDQPITSTLGITIPANGQTTVSMKTLDQLEGEPYMARQFRKLNLVAEPDAPVAETSGDEPVEAAPTRADVAKMKRDDLVSWLCALSEDLSPDLLAEVKVEDGDGTIGLRTMLANALFVDL